MMLRIKRLWWKSYFKYESFYLNKSKDRSPLQNGTAPIAKISETPIPFADGMRVATPADYTQPTQPATTLDNTMAIADKAKTTGLNIKQNEKECQIYW